MNKRAPTFLDPILLVVGLLLLGVGHWLGLVWAPPDVNMGEVQRIMYVHVPAAWMTLLAYTATLVGSVMYLFKKAPHWDALAESAAEVGVFFNALAIVLGSIWGRPTWGVYWTWDPRLTTAAIMLVAFSGYLALRRFVDDPERRASWAAVFAVVAYADLPLVWFSVRWWRSLHQIQSSPSTVHRDMRLALWVSAFAFLALLALFISRRYRIAQARWRRELAPPEAS